MPTIEVEGSPRTLTDDEKAEFDELVAQHIDPRTAVAIATGEFQDINPPDASD